MFFKDRHGLSCPRQPTGGDVKVLPPGTLQTGLRPPVYLQPRVNAERGLRSDSAIALFGAPGGAPRSPSLCPRPPGAARLDPFLTLALSGGRADPASTRETPVREEQPVTATPRGKRLDAVPAAEGTWLRPASRRLGHRRGPAVVGLLTPGLR